ncbi:MAG TPA: retropepsin-like aspartic protease, partial [Planctomycetota bacterium]|nr:retropepsin-like aspartic protease [Planctomycetota bacterium]
VDALPWRAVAAEPFASERPLASGEVPEFECAAADRRRPFAIDTGSSMTTLSRSLAAELGVRNLRPAGSAVDGTGREVAIALGVLPAFAVGDARLGDVPVLVVEDGRLALRDLFGGAERAPQGILGLDQLSRFRLTLDPVRQSVAFESPRGLSEGESVQCVHADGRVLLPVTIADLQFWFVLDTGASHSSLTQAGLQRLPDGERSAVPSFRRVRTTGGGTVAVREVRDQVLRCSLARWRGVTLPVIARTASQDFPMHGVLGLDLLLLCRVTIDRGRARLQAVR